MIGPFFYINGKILATPEQVDLSQTGKVDSSLGHIRLYRGIKGTLKPKDALHPYEYWPRGRVIYDTKERRYFIYLDVCIQDKETIRKKIIKVFALEKENITWGGDSHYLCHRCNPDFVDID